MKSWGGLMRTIIEEFTRDCSCGSTVRKCIATSPETGERWLAVRCDRCNSTLPLLQLTPVPPKEA